MKLDYEAGTKLFRACANLSLDYGMSMGDRAQALIPHIRDFQNEITAKADAEVLSANAEMTKAKLAYDEGLLAVRTATAAVVQKYIERIAELERQIATGQPPTDPTQPPANNPP